jgi:predicted ATPase
MITKLLIDNFKSLVDFELPPKGHALPPFVCLIGLNGSGKSTLLQAFDFLGQLVIGKIDEWLEVRDWKARDVLNGRLPRRNVVTFDVHFSFDGVTNLVWKGRFNAVQLRCTYESLKSGGKTLLELNEGKLTVKKETDGVTEIPDLDLVFQGSVLSLLKLSGMHPDVLRVKQSLLGLKSLELLSPQLMRRKARKADDIGKGGEKLSPFLAQLSPKDKGKLHEQLHEFYPQFRKFFVKGYRAGWKELRVVENYGSRNAVEATHLNDGMLRVIAILAQAYTSHSFLLFDEIENGINPELVEKLVKFLVDLGKHGKQVMVTTHSPMILNYIPDEVAKKSVILLYRSEQGQTRCMRFFDLPETERKLRALGPGEVFVDTKLGELVEHLSEDVPA